MAVEAPLCSVCGGVLSYGCPATKNGNGKHLVLPAPRSSCEYSERPSAVYAAYCDDNHCACPRCVELRDAL